MRLVDVNLLIYATNDRAPRHDRAHGWFEELMSSGETVALPLVVLLAFVRLVTNPRVLDPPLSAEAATGYVRSWQAHPTVIVPEPTSRHFKILRELLDATGTGGNLVTDAHLAALALEHGATICSADSDFARFPGVTTENPIAS